MWAGSPGQADFSPDGRLLAAGPGGVRVWDAASGRAVAHVPTGDAETVLFHPAGTSLITYGRGGVRRRPILPRTGPGGALRFGPPQTLNLSSSKGVLRACLGPGGAAGAY
jgi:hypothetical protein